MKRWFFLILPLLAACHPASPDPNGGNGELHEGSFFYSCSSDADAFCADQVKAPLPEGIAVGADFHMSFADGMNTLEADPAMIEIGANGAMHAKRAGYAAVLAHAANGDVIDFVNVHIHVVSQIAVRDADGLSLGMKIGDSHVVRAEPLDETGSALAGTLTFAWETSDANVVVVEGSRGNTATLRAVGAGSARVRVVSGSSTGVVSVNVGGA